MTMSINDENPKMTIRQNSFLNSLKNTGKVISLFVLTRSFAASMTTIPSNGKIKNTIPKIGVTWCEVTVTAIKDKLVNKYLRLPVFTQR